ncbi:group III truncated hemoglobin [Helicobacter trogontum]|uniref:Group III truncated hemoglobin n=2 Tax=Helicobacter trogontum TaxID=50960 RepID=A0A099VKT2_9HELI|nr:group III truncated hemoglobin [Helicobacter trogontum]MDY5184820.1 group III truncated hemoglobin [Helicobacter trogontum]TLD82488.1 group III truncated hemoglobin [Helicobacter trogontum]TLD96661.1 group III truncated hemoglobin [Helicobacter trogontum]
MQEKFNMINEDSILKLMDTFYNKVRSDKRGLGDVFNAKIGTDEESWQKHKAKIATFWQGMLLGTGDYSGHPLKAHLDLPPFPRELFAVWLELFKQSLESVYAQEEHVAMIMERAEMIAKRFMFMLYESGYNRA